MSINGKLIRPFYFKNQFALNLNADSALSQKRILFIVINILLIFLSLLFFFTKSNYEGDIIYLSSLGKSKNIKIVNFKKNEIREFFIDLFQLKRVNDLYQNLATIINIPSMNNVDYEKLIVDSTLIKDNLTIKDKYRNNSQLFIKLMLASTNYLIESSQTISLDVKLIIEKYKFDKDIDILTRFINSFLSYGINNFPSTFTHGDLSFSNILIPKFDKFFFIDWEHYNQRVFFYDFFFILFNEFYYTNNHYLIDQFFYGRFDSFLIFLFSKFGVNYISDNKVLYYSFSFLFFLNERVHFTNTHSLERYSYILNKIL